MLCNVERARKYGMQLFREAPNAQADSVRPELVVTYINTVQGLELLDALLIVVICCFERICA